MLPEEDIKIYHNDEDNSPDTKGEGERSAELFLLHRNNGNLSKCRELGKLLGVTFADEAKRFADDPLRRQKLVLLSFVLSDELAGLIFDQMLQQSVMSVFGQTVESLDSGLAADIKDSTAYTLYMLGERSDDSGMGEIFAELCDCDGDVDTVLTGTLLEQEHRKLYANIITSYLFISV